MARVCLNLEDDRSISSVYRRIVYRLIAIEYNRPGRPDITYFPDFILSVGKKHQLLFPHFYSWFLFYAKNVAQGFRMSELRDTHIPEGARRVHKKRLHRAPR